MQIFMSNEKGDDTPRKDMTIDAIPHRHGAGAHRRPA
jgi:hypothetical protein